MNDYTNFHNYSHGDMRKMVHSMDSGGVMAASDPWRRASQTLKDIRAALNTASGDAIQSWEGNTSDAFHQKMLTLANHVNTAAAYANDAAVSMQMMSEAIDQAKRDMPEEPGFWDEVGDGIKDFAENSVGMGGPDTQVPIADKRKAQAVGVMETLATKYRATAQYLKPPGSNGLWREDKESISSDSPAEAISALIMGGGMGAVGSSRPQGGVPVAARSSGPSAGRSPMSPKVVPEGPTDSGIRGMANPASTPKTPAVTGPGTGIDSVQTIGVPATGKGGLAGAEGTVLTEHSGTQGVSGTPIGSSLGRNTPGQGGSRAGAVGAESGLGAGKGAAGRGASAFGAGGMEGGKGLGAGGKGGAGGKSGSSLARKGGGVVGEAAGGSGKRAFTEGGSGLGRGRVGQGSGGQGMLHGSQAGKKDKKEGKGRPDYLVEDEETWASGEKSNPNVVE